MTDVCLGHLTVQANAREPCQVNQVVLTLHSFLHLPAQAYVLSNISQDVATPASEAIF